MFELLSDHLERVRPLFDRPHLKLVIDAVSAGNSPGWVWVDDPRQPRSALLWDKTHAVYLAGAADNAAFNEGVRRLSAERISREVEVFKAYNTSEAWDGELEHIFPNAMLHRQRARVFCRLAGLKIPEWRERIPRGFQVSEINGAFEALARLANFERVVEEIELCWNALEGFRQRGFGFCVHDAETVAGWCTAEYVSGDQCGVGIETIEAYGRRGFATLTASAFAEHALAHGIKAHWDAWATNAPSVRMAEKVGFEKVEDYTVTFGEFSPTHTA